jgi:hypothetical protein
MHLVEGFLFEERPNRPQPLARGRAGLDAAQCQRAGVADVILAEVEVGQPGEVR